MACGRAEGAAEAAAMGGGGHANVLVLRVSNGNLIIDRHLVMNWFY